MSDEKTKKDATGDAPGAAGAADDATRLGRAMSVLASGMMGPPDAAKPLSALELSELRSLMATGAYAASQGVAGPSPAASPAPGAASQPTPASPGKPLSTAEISAVRTMMMVRPYVPHPMPGATSAAVDEGGGENGEVPGQRDGEV